jgi:hypothetical protein
MPMENYKLHKQKRTKRIFSFLFFCTKVQQHMFHLSVPSVNGKKKNKPMKHSFPDIKEKVLYNPTNYMEKVVWT